MPVPGDPLKSALPDDVLDEEGEGRQLHGRRCAKRGTLQVDCLAWSAGFGATLDQCGEACRVGRTIRIDDDDDGWRPSLQRGSREIECKTFTAALRIEPLHHLNANAPRNFGGVIDT